MTWSPRTPQQREEYVQSVLNSEGFSLDPEIMRKAIARCDQQIEDLRNLQDQARRELYMESLGIGEEHFEAARLIVQKYMHKAIGGGKIAFESSAVGFFEGHIMWTESFRDDLQAVLDGHLAADQQSADDISSVGNNL